jgi:predicted amidophosphoribosyltransferase
VDCGKDVRKEGKICSKCDEKLKIKIIKKIKKNETKGNYSHKMII